MKTSKSGSKQEMSCLLSCSFLWLDYLWMMLMMIMMKFANSIYVLHVMVAGRHLKTSSL